MPRVLFLRDASGQWRAPLASDFPTRPAEPAPVVPLEPVIEVADLSPRALRDALAAPDVLAFAPVMPTRLVSPEPLDSFRPEDAQPGWGLRAVAADRSGETGDGVTVALLDTGLDTRHPAFDGITLVKKDFAGTGVEDANGHGTHVAGTAFGRDVGGTRIGVARGVRRAVIAKALTDQGRGTSETFLRALLWSATEGAEIIGFALALDVSGWVETLEAEGCPHSLACVHARHAERATLDMLETVLRMFAVNARFDGGRLVIGAVGNDSRRMIAAEMETGPVAPACAAGVLTVGALSPDEGQGYGVAPFSNTGAMLAAPGAAVISAHAGDGLRSLNGTSMALAHAVGISALWWQRLREEDQADAASVAQRLLVSATRADLAPEVTAHDCGAGLVQAPRSGVSRV